IIVDAAQRATQLVQEADNAAIAAARAALAPDIAAADAHTAGLRAENLEEWQAYRAALHSTVLDRLTPGRGELAQNLRSARAAVHDAIAAIGTLGPIERWLATVRRATSADVKACRYARGWVAERREELAPWLESLPAIRRDREALDRTLPIIARH